MNDVCQGSTENSVGEFPYLVASEMVLYYLDEVVLTGKKYDVGIVLEVKLGKNTGAIGLDCFNT